MRRIGTALGAAGAAVLVSCAPSPQEEAPPQERVVGPGGVTYAVPGGAWTVVPDGLTWRDRRGRVIASLSGTISFDQGYAVGRCGEDFSARAVAGFARGSGHGAVVRRFVRAVGGPSGYTSRSETPQAWRPSLADGTRVRLTRRTVEVPDPGRCRADAVDLAVLTLPGSSDGEQTSWVYVGDQGPEAAAEAEVVAVAASLRRGSTVDP